jgi:hypothetical protein
MRRNVTLIPPCCIYIASPSVAMFRLTRARLREDWEFIPTPEHKSLVLLLYRQTLKSLLNYKSVRKRTVIALTRMTFRRRAKATEKLLIDECIEESRRNLMILGKMQTFTKTGEYEFETTGLPKDTGQDVKTYMEEMYDPEMSKQFMMATQDVTPDNEAEHKGRLHPKYTKEEYHAKFAALKEDRVGDDIRDMRPPPPPEM